MIRRGLMAAALLAMLVLCAAVPAFAAGERTIGVSAASFDFSAVAGQTGVGTVWVNNGGDEPVSVRVYASDQVVGSTGNVTFVTPSLDTNVLQSPASWMTVKLPPNAKFLGNIPYIDLEPGDKAQVDFSVDIPQGAVPGDHNILLFFEMFDPNPTGSNQQTRVFGRLGTRVKARVEGEIVEDIKVAPFVMPARVLGSAVPYSFTLSNRGNVDERVTVRMVELDSSDAEVSSTMLATDTPLYANSSLQKNGTIRVGATKLGRARYKVAVSYPSQTPGANGLTKTVEEERAVWVIPVWLPYAIGAILLLLLVFAVWAAGRRSAERKARKVQADAAVGLGQGDSDL